MIEKKFRLEKQIYDNLFVGQEKIVSLRESFRIGMMVFEAENMSVVLVSVHSFATEYRIVVVVRTSRQDTSKEKAVV